jgi:hypothetical protein
MHKTRLSVAGTSVLFALALAGWEVYFFWFAGSFKSLEGKIGLFGPERVGFNLAWVAAVYLTFQLLSIPFSLPSVGNRFAGVVDGMASLIPLAVVLIVVFGKPHLLLGNEQRWEAAFLLIFVTLVDLFGGYTFSLAAEPWMWDPSNMDDGYRCPPFAASACASRACIAIRDEVNAMPQEG